MSPVSITQTRGKLSKNTPFKPITNNYDKILARENMHNKEEIIHVNGIDPMCETLQCPLYFEALIYGLSLCDDPEDLRIPFLVECREAKGIIPLLKLEYTVEGFLKPWQFISMRKKGTKIVADYFEVSDRLECRARKHEHEQASESES